MSHLAAGTPTCEVLVAEPDRRFYAFVIDRTIAWAVYAAAGVAAWAVFFRRDHVGLGVVAVALVVLVVWFAGAMMTGLGGATPGKSVCRLKVVSVHTGRQIGLRSALLRQGVLGIATLPTLGIAAASLAWMATADPTGHRRGWHDRLARSVVIDVRPRTVEYEEAAPAARGIVNLTAMRLMPAPPVPEPEAAPSLSRESRSRTPPAPPAPAGGGPTGIEPGSPAPPGERAAARWRVTFDTGESFVVAGLALVGRRPEPRPGEQVSHLVALTSSDRSLSKTHAQFQVVPDGTLVVMDRGSTNGSILIRQGAARALGARRPTTLMPGDRVRFGDREMQVVREA